MVNHEVNPFVLENEKIDNEKLIEFNCILYGL